MRTSKKTGNKQRKKILKKIIFWKAKVLTVLFFIYCVASLGLDPGFITRDAREKYAWAADSLVSVTIPDRPGQPVPVASAGCLSGNPYVNLSWIPTTDTTNYSITRDILPLVSGLVASSYHDVSVAESSSYDYVVTAVGPMGQTSSIVVSAAVPADCPAVIPASCSIQTIDTENVANFSGIPKTENQKPTITGTSNIANAIVSIWPSPQILNTNLV